MKSFSSLFYLFCRSFLVAYCLVDPLSDVLLDKFLFCYSNVLIFGLKHDFNVKIFSRAAPCG